MTKAWDYMKSRGERERAKYKHEDKVSKEWDFTPSRRDDEPTTKERNELKKRISEGWVPVRSDSEIATLSRQLCVDQLFPSKSHPHRCCVPVWFAALFALTPEPKAVLGVASDELKARVERLRNGRNEQLLVVGEYLLTCPHGDSDTKAAAIAFIEKFRVGTTLG